jgi:Rieske Fe-S protein
MSDTRVGATDEASDEATVGRRTVLRGVAVGGVGVAGLAAACGSDDDSSDSSDDSGAGTTESSEPSEPSGGGGGGEPLGPTSEVPVGGGTVYTDQEVVVTQPAAGDYKGFTAICTHQGCTVGEVADGTINCPCHGSMYSIEDGSVVGGPAPAALAEEKLVVDGGSIDLA